MDPSHHPTPPLTIFLPVPTKNGLGLSPTKSIQGTYLQEAPPVLVPSEILLSHPVLP